MTEPTEAMVEAGRKSWVDAITDPEHDGNGGPVFAEMYRRMKALDPDTHRASLDEVERLREALSSMVRLYDSAKWDNDWGTEAAIVEQARAAMSVQSGEG